ncbi:MAG: hypothetical protein PHO63_02160 [Bacilli bacterium]|nr:hypothetical protein [Bacilli bacterium]
MNENNNLNNNENVQPVGPTPAINSFEPQNPVIEPTNEVIQPVSSVDPFGPQNPVVESVQEVIGFEAEMVNPVEPQNTVIQPVTEVVQPVMPTPTVNPVEPQNPVIQPVTEAVQPVMPTPTVNHVEPQNPVIQPVTEVVQTVMPTPTVNPVEPQNPVIQPVENVTPVEPAVIEPVIPQPVETPPVTNQSNEATATSKPYKKSKKGLIIGVLLVLILVMAVVGVYVFFSMNKKSSNAFMVSLNNLKTDMSEMVEPVSFFPEDYDDIYTLVGKMNLKINLSEQDESDLGGIMGIIPSEAMDNIISTVNETDFNYTIKTDVDNNKLLFQFNPYFNNEELINIKFYNNNTNNYLFLGHIYNKYIQLEDMEVKISDIVDRSMKAEELKTLYDTIIKSIKDNLKDEYFKQEDATIKIDDVEKEVLKSTLILNEANFRELYSNVTKDLAKNKETNKIITKYNPDFFTNKLEENETISEDGTIYFSTYMNKLTAKHYQYELKITSEYEDITIDYIIGDETEMNVTSTTKYYEEETSTFKVLINKEKTKTTFKINDKDNKNIINLELSKNKMVYNQTSKYSDPDAFTESEEMNVNINFAYELKETESKDDYTIITSSIVQVTQSNKNLLTVNLNSDNLLTKKVTIDEDVSNVIHIDNLQEEDYNEMMNELYNIVMKITE